MDMRMGKRSDMVIRITVFMYAYYSVRMHEEISTHVYA